MRMMASCGRCFHQGNRRDFYKDRPNNVPNFDDVCPRCGSKNVDIIDPRVFGMKMKEAS